MALESESCFPNCIFKLFSFSLDHLLIFDIAGRVVNAVFNHVPPIAMYVITVRPTRRPKPEISEAVEILRQLSLSLSMGNGKRPNLGSTHTCSSISNPLTPELNHRFHQFNIAV